ncbi:putative oxidoreductase, aryl-alcohol dehydrogenase like protein [Polaromonas sp. CF318]|uniref:aldo/keto reductase n=1 Tax=Polaromonas sp. CF318 TaxID=1144318 RepID=UPI0002713608|nr:aldo/keto reductase [Polaromonas sp. CF318]EJL77534.1 putative oxidoreductase, aryl-alcohol dehydrogenase like protein [Polaromonas sp. CF318]
MNTTTLAQTRLGTKGPQSVSAIGLGAMGMSAMYGAADEAQSIATIHAALDAGINLIDTGDFYGMGHNEMLIGRALKGRRDQALVSVKFGALRDPSAGWIGMDGRPAAVKNFLAYSLQRLGTDHIDIYRIARLDPNVPIEDTIGAIADMVKAGFVRHIGLSEVGADTIRKAHAVHPITDLQIEYSLLSRGPEAGIFPVLKRLGIGVTAYGVLSRGLLSGSKPTGPGDFRAHLPRFTGENAAKNQRLVDVLQQLAAGLGATASQVAIAWVLARGKALGVDMVALVGSRTLKQLGESLGALKLTLGSEDLQRIEAALPADAVAGTRYAAEQMAHLDSEK